MADDGHGAARRRAVGRISACAASGWGRGNKRYRLVVVESEGPAGVKLRGSTTLVLSVPAAWTAEERRELLHRWYRAQLRELVPPLLEKWERKLGVTAREWRIKRMKTKWGSCNAKAKLVWLNLELAKKSPGCLEYVVVHELVHLMVRKHGERFLGLMDRHLPGWRRRRAELNAAPLAAERWGCRAGPADSSTQAVRASGSWWNGRPAPGSGVEVPDSSVCRVEMRKVEICGEQEAVGLDGRCDDPEIVLSHLATEAVAEGIDRGVAVDDRTGVDVDDDEPVQEFFEAIQLRLPVVVPRRQRKQLALRDDADHGRRISGSESERVDHVPAERCLLQYVEHDTRVHEPPRCSTHESWPSCASRSSSLSSPGHCPRRDSRPRFGVGRSAVGVA